MALPISIEDALISLSEDGIGLLLDTAAECSDFNAHPVEPVTKRSVAGHRGKKLDQKFECWEGSFKARVISVEGMLSAKRNQDAYLAGRSMPARALTVRERYRDASNARGDYQFVNMYIEHEGRSLTDNEGMQDFKFTAEKVI